MSPATHGFSGSLDQRLVEKIWPEADANQALQLARADELLRFGADRHARSPEGWSCLELAAAGGHAELIARLHAEDLALGWAAAPAGAEPASAAMPAEVVERALRAVARSGSVAAIETLAGLHPEAVAGVDAAGRTLLHHAVLCAASTVASCQALIAAGVPEAALDAEGRTAWELAAAFVEEPQDPLLDPYDPRAAPPGSGKAILAGIDSAPSDALRAYAESRVLALAIGGPAASEGDGGAAKADPAGQPLVATGARAAAAPGEPGEPAPAAPLRRRILKA